MHGWKAAPFASMQPSSDGFLPLLPLPLQARDEKLWQERLEKAAQQQQVGPAEGTGWGHTKPGDGGRGGRAAAMHTPHHRAERVFYHHSD